MSSDDLAFVFRLKLQNNKLSVRAWDITNYDHYVCELTDASINKNNRFITNLEKMYNVLTELLNNEDLITKFEPKKVLYFDITLSDDYHSDKIELNFDFIQNDEDDKKLLRDLSYGFLETKTRVSELEKKVSSLENNNSHMLDLFKDMCNIFRDTNKRVNEIEEAIYDDN